MFVHLNLRVGLSCVVPEYLKTRTEDYIFLFDKKCLISFYKWSI